MSRTKLRCTKEDSKNRIVSFLLSADIYVKKGFEKQLLCEIIDWFNYSSIAKHYITYSDLRDYKRNKEFTLFVDSLNMTDDNPFIHFRNVNVLIKTMYVLKRLKEIVKSTLNNNFTYDLNDFIFHKRIGLLLLKYKHLNKFVKQDSLDMYYIAYNESLKKHSCLNNFFELISPEDKTAIEIDLKSIFE